MEFKDHENCKTGGTEDAKKLWSEVRNLVIKKDISDKKETIIYNLKRNQNLILKTQLEIKNEVTKNYLKGEARALMKKATTVSPKKKVNYMDNMKNELNKQYNL